MSNSESTPSSIPSKGFTRYVDGIEEAVLNFQVKEYPERTFDSILPYWNWLFLESAQRLDIEPMVWMYLKDNAITAHQGAIAVVAKVRESHVVTGWFVETMAAEHARGTAIGPMIIKKALSDLPTNLSLGQTDQMRELQFAMGWKEQAQLETLQLILSPWISLSRRLPSWLGRVASTFLYYWQSYQRKPANTYARKYDAHIVSEFSETYDQIWQEMALDIDCGVVRDRSYLNWKYGGREGFLRLELRNDGLPVGAVVVAVREKDKEFSYTRAVIVDVIGPVRDRELQLALLWYTQEHLRTSGIEVVWQYTSCNELCDVAKQFGFLSRGMSYHFLTAGPSLEDSSFSWFLSAGDSDLDTYA